MKQNDIINTFLSCLMEDSDEYHNLKIPDTVEEKKALIRSLMNIRIPKAIPEKLLYAQNQYLQEESALNGCISLSEIPTVKEQYNSTHPFANNISIWQGDITRLCTDAIVNAANSQMLGCFIPCHRCIDNAIHSAAGMQLREECNHIMNRKRIQYGRQYEEPVGTAILTDSYNLPCNYVIHTVGPIVYDGLTESLRQDLRNCYESVLNCCMDNRITSVAFCCISTGEFHFPNEEAAKIAVETVTGFLSSHVGCGITRVLFNVFKDADRTIYEKILGH